MIKLSLKETHFYVYKSTNYTIIIYSDFNSPNLNPIDTLKQNEIIFVLKRNKSKFNNNFIQVLKNDTLGWIFESSSHYKEDQFFEEILFP